MKIFKKNNVKLQQKRNESKKNLENYAFLSMEELYTSLSAAPGGLTSEQVEERQDEYGKNVITSGNKNTVLHRLREAVINPFNIVLFVISVITFFTDVIYSPKPDYLTVGIILSLIILSSLVAFVQSERSNAAAEKLSKMISNKADVLRDGKQIEIPMSEIVPGDMVRLSAGDMIPADIRF